MWWWKAWDGLRHFLLNSDTIQISVLEYVNFSSLPDWLYLGQNDLSTHKHFVMVEFL